MTLSPKSTPSEPSEPAAPGPPAAPEMSENVGVFPRASADPVELAIERPTRMDRAHVDATTARLEPSIRTALGTENHDLSFLIWPNFPERRPISPLATTRSCGSLPCGRRYAQSASWADATASPGTDPAPACDLLDSALLRVLTLHKRLRQAQTHMKGQLSVLTTSSAITGLRGSVRRRARGH